MKKISILIADDHAVVRVGLTTMLGYQADFSVVGEARDGAEAVRLAHELEPDVILMDLMMPVIDGVEATRQILSASFQRPPRILILTTFGNSAEVANAIAAGASGVIVKDAGTEELFKAIRRISAGQEHYSEEAAASIPSTVIRPFFSARQREVLEAASRGLSNSDIGRMLGISRDMVKRHMKMVCRKIGAANRTEAVAIALKRNLLKI